MLGKLAILSAILSAYVAPRSADVPEFISVYLTTQHIEEQGYVAETHHVTTEDGYILEIHRIPYPRYQNEFNGSRPVVFVMHGLTAASNAFIVLGPEYSIAYNLADAGFDVWMGNARGTKNSRFHVSLNADTNPRSFFDFSWEEIGMYDMPVMIDYVLNYTGVDKLHYIGHSQGGAIFLVLNSMRPEYNKKFVSAHLLAGVGYMTHFPDEEMQSVSSNVNAIYSLADISGIVEMYPSNSTSESEPSQGYSRFDACVGNVKYKSLCDSIGVRKYALSRDDKDDEMSLLDVFHQPNDALGGGAIKQVAHFGQNIRDKAFRRWDYGFQNIFQYGSLSPPAFDISLITVPVMMHYTLNDYLQDERDVLAMAADMPNCDVRKVARDSFLHEDFLVAFDAKELVTDYVIEAIANTEANRDSDENADSDEETPIIEEFKEENLTEENLTEESEESNEVEEPSGPSFSVYFTAQYIEEQGYVAETHHVTTEDGFILEMHRIPYPRYENIGQRRPVVFLMHGFTSASNAFIVLGSENSLAYNLADAGFDVWMGNGRGTKNSRFHITLDADSDKIAFFDFSWDEIGNHDLPSMIDYILEITKQKRLHYIGHSQGGTVFFVLNSLRPEYNEKFLSAHLLAPSGYMENFPDEELAQTAANTDIIYNMAVQAGTVEIYPPSSNDAVGKEYSRFDTCFGHLELKSLCDTIKVRYYSTMTKDGKILDQYLTTNEAMGGGSKKQIAHFGQNVRDKTFRRWNFGTAENLLTYGTDDPPSYDLSLITVNVTIHYTVSDNLIGVQDVLAMADVMPNAVARRVARDSFSHNDFVYGIDAKDLITDIIIEAIEYVELTQTDEEEEEDDEDSQEIDENITEEDNDNNNDTEENIDETDSNENIDVEESGPVTDSATNVALSVIFKTFLIIYILFFIAKQL